jgi:ribosomal protein S3AE
VVSLKVRMTPNRHDLYRLGLICATKEITGRGKNASLSKSLKIFLIRKIKSLIKYQKLTIEEITVTGPDGMKRKLNPMVFTIISE